MTFHALISEFASQTNRFYKTKTRIYVLPGNLSNLGQTPSVSFWITDVLFFLYTDASDQICSRSNIL